ncbi:MAG: hypothetical protein IKN17_03580 [Ruminococcus sp.]|nr:hypothetical protein [Ruminococcus sp.]
MSVKNPHDGHRSRMRKRLELDPHLSGFSEHEILEVMLYYCLPRVNTNELAHRLIMHFGSLASVMSRTPDELAAIGIISRNCAVSLTFFSSVARYLGTGGRAVRVSISDIRAVKQLVFSGFAGLGREAIRIYGVSPRKEISVSRLIDRGFFSSVQIDIQLLIDTARSTRCSDIIIAHNHPESDCEPSDPDIVNTRIIARELSERHIHLLDHLIVGDSEVFSFREHGLVFDT